MVGGHVPALLSGRAVKVIPAYALCLTKEPREHVVEVCVDVGACIGIRFSNIGLRPLASSGLGDDEAGSTDEDHGRRAPRRDQTLQATVESGALVHPERV